LGAPQNLTGNNPSCFKIQIENPGTTQLTLNNVGCARKSNQLILVSDIYFLKTFTANKMLKVTKMSAALGIGKKGGSKCFFSELDLGSKPLK